MLNEARHPRVLIVAEHASARFGGEAILPLHHFRMLRRRGIEAWLIVHARTRGELSQILADELDRIHFIPDSWFHKLLHQLGKPLPGRLRHFSLGYLSRLSSQRKARKVARQMIRAHQIEVVHQPIPVSPKESSLLYGLGVPVIIGPMNGGMSYPPGFRHGQQGFVERWFLRIGRWASGTINRLMPGKLRADVLLVANERTRQALPPAVRGKVITLTENGIDLPMWTRIARPENSAGPTRFVFTGRLIPLKGVQFLLDAFRNVVGQTQATLGILGDGPMRSSLEAQAKSMGLERHVHFHGWVAQADVPNKLAEADVLVLPSLHECGGAVVLEAMAMGLPVIASDWGGPADYVDPSCGILVPAQSPEQFTRDLAAALLKLAHSPEIRRSMGQAGRKKIEDEFDWERKADRMLEIYREAISTFHSRSVPRTAPEVQRLST